MHYNIFGSPKQVACMQTDILYETPCVSWLHALLVIFLETGNNNPQPKHQ